MAEATYLNDQEVEAFLDDLDRNKDGMIDFSEIDRKLVEVHAEIAPQAKKHNLHYGGTVNAERTAFLRKMLGTEKNVIPRKAFADTVRSWNVPSMAKQKKADKDGEDYTKCMSIGRRLRAYWAVRGPTLVFLTLVVSLQIAFSVWMFVKYYTGPKYRTALGWGVVMVSNLHSIDR